MTEILAENMELLTPKNVSQDVSTMNSVLGEHDSSNNSVKDDSGPLPF